MSDTKSTNFGAEIMTPFSSRNTKKTSDPTRKANPSPATPGGIRQGEGIPPGSNYSATLREWANLSPSSTENAGPEAPSANATMLSEVTMADRRTGRI